MTSPTRVLVVDDEAYLADMVGTALRYEGFEAAVAGSCRETLRRTEAFQPHLIVLDVMLPDGSGVDVCRKLRDQGRRTPVVFLTAKDAVDEKVSALRVGDDYVTKPFSLDELIARVRAVLRRVGGDGKTTTRQLCFADLEIDEDAHRVRRAGTPMELSPTEFTLLRYLTANAGRVLSKRQILQHVWEYDFGGNDGVVATYISYLRRKIDAGRVPLIQTVPRVGYVLRLPEGVQEDR